MFLFTDLQHLVESIVERKAFLISTYLGKRSGRDGVD